jgi:hypothetical protein
MGTKVCHWLARCQIKLNDGAEFLRVLIMLSYIFYLLAIGLLIYWVETPVLGKSKALIIKKDPAEELESWLKKFNWSQRHELVQGENLARYKFYTDIVEQLLQLSRKMGGTYQESLLFLREGLQSDRQSEKKMRDLIFGIWFQMAVMVMLTWGFIFSALAMIEVSMAPWRLLMIALWQGVGLGLLPMLLAFFRQRLFADIGRLWKMLYILRSLEKVPLARSEVMALAEVTELKKIQQKNLQHLVEKLKQTCQRSLQQGGSYEQDVLSLMAELRFQEKWHFELFEKRLMVIKIGLLALFFLPSYLAFIFLLMGDLINLV